MTTKPYPSSDILSLSEGRVIIDREAEIKAPCFITDGVKLYPLEIDLDGFIGLYKVVATISPFTLSGVKMVEIPSEAELLAEIHLSEFMYQEDIPLSKEDKRLRQLVDRCHKESFIAGYQASQQKYKFTEDDLRKAFEAGKDFESDSQANISTDSFEEHLQSLSHSPEIAEIILNEDDLLNPQSNSIVPVKVTFK